MSIMERWDGMLPSRFDWQVLITRKSGRSMVFQFPKTMYPTRTRILRRANEYAEEVFGVAYKVRDDLGTVIYDGPVLDALGKPKASHP